MLTKEELQIIQDALEQVEFEYALRLNKDSKSYSSEELINKIKLINKPVETTNEQPKDGIYYDGKFLEMCYEELVDLFATFRDKGDFKSCLLTKDKASNVFGSLLPMSSY